MKLLIVGDVHWSQYSSIIRERTSRFSARLENLIQSVNWVERTAEKNDCNAIIYLGDFFDKSELNAEEITALRYVGWSYIKHFFLCGNHEMGDKYHNISSAHVLGLMTGCYVIDKPVTVNEYACEICFIPYITDDERKPITEYCEKPLNNKKLYIMSHNDLQIQYGAYKSVNGFTVDEIEDVDYCNRFFNGHLHNRSAVSHKIENVGNLTGQNFGEDALIYEHGVVIYDTESDIGYFVENPYAFNFYKLTEQHVLGNPCLGKLKNNAIVSMSCKEYNYDTIKRWLDEHSKLSRIQVQRDVTNPSAENKIEITKVDHLAKFTDYVLSNIGNDELVQSEIGEVTI